MLLATHHFEMYLDLVVIAYQFGWYLASHETNYEAMQVQEEPRDLVHRYSVPNVVLT